MNNWLKIPIKNDESRIKRQTYVNVSEIIFFDSYIVKFSDGKLCYRVYLYDSFKSYKEIVLDSREDWEEFTNKLKEMLIPNE